MKSFRMIAGKIANRLVPKVLFGNVSWIPRGRIPFYIAYYPESLRAEPLVSDLFRRWIAGNRENNNGDAARFVSLLLNARKVISDGVPGAFAELGVWKGNSAALLADVARRGGRQLFLFDTFSGFDQRDFVGLDSNQADDFTDTSMDLVRRTIGNTDSVTLVPGFFPETVTADMKDRVFAFVHLDCDLYEPMKAGIEFFYPRLSPGGLLILHDYSSGAWPGATAAIDEYCLSIGQRLVLLPDKSGTAILSKPM